MPHRIDVTPTGPHTFLAVVGTGRSATRHRVVLTRSFLAGAGPMDEELVAHQAVSALARTTAPGHLPGVIRLTVPYPQAPGLLDELRARLAG